MRLKYFVINFAVACAGVLVAALTVRFRPGLGPVAGTLAAYLLYSLLYWILVAPVQFYVNGVLLAREPKEEKPRTVLLVFAGIAFGDLTALLCLTLVRVLQGR